MKLDIRQRLLATTLLVGANLVAAPAFAQVITQPAEPIGTDESPSGPVETLPPSEVEVGATGAPRVVGEEIVVTGSRIARPNVESTSPVTVLGSQQIEETGTTRIEDVLNSLPQVTPGQTAFVANGATGTATVNLRGLGTVRTLVLVNGRRLQPGSPFLPVADLNQIPSSLVERIEVLTGGASSTYGADAVAGVVNFIMDTDFKGFQLDSTYGVYQHNNKNDQVIDFEPDAAQGGRTPGNTTIRDRMEFSGFPYPKGNTVDGAQWETTATLGAGFDDGRGNVVAYLGYRQVDALLQAARDYSSCAITRATSGSRGPANQADGFGRVDCGGSSTAPLATIVDPSFGGAFFGVADGSDDFSGFGQPGATPYNYAPINHFQRPDKRWTAGAFANYEISEAIEPYAEFMFMDDRSVAQIAQSGTFFADVISLSCDSPLLTEAQGDLLCAEIDGNPTAGDFIDTDGDEVNDTDPTGAGVVPILIGKRNVEGGGRQADLRHTGYRAVLGTRGDLNERFSYDVSGQFGTTIFSQTYLNDFSRSRLRRSLSAVVDGDGNVVCSVNADADASNDDPACVPYNPFQGQGIVGVGNETQGITQAALDYVATPGFQRGDLKEHVVNGYVTGELFNLMSVEPVSMVVGAEYRKEQLDLQSDVAFESGDLAGQGGPSPSVKGQFDVKELFGELLVPIVSDRPFMHRLTLELGYRYSDYSLGFSTDTYKIAGEYYPVPELKIRGGYNRAVRAPNVLELFTPNALALWSGSDPCAGEEPEYTFEQCARTGVTAGQYGNIVGSPADQYNQIIGGNENLDPEKADTWTLGAVFEPRPWLPGFVATVDYFNIKVEDAIATIGAETILNQCGLTGNAEFCSLIRRNPISGDLWVGSDQSSPIVGRITNLTQNIGGLEATGIDLGVSYFRDMDFMPRFARGRIGLDIQGTYLIDSKVDTGIPTEETDGVYDCKGFHGSICGFPTPEWRHTARLSWTAPSGIGLSLRWRHIGAVDLDEFSQDADLGDDNPDARGNIDSHDYLDLTAIFNVTEQFRMMFGVNNIFDTDPPIFPSAFGGDNANTWAGTYDPVGRKLFVSGTLRF